MPDLVHLIYCSAATKPFSRTELSALLKRARANNERCGITGMLLHAEGSFFQVLEGDAAMVDALFAAISSDQRHARITLIIREPIAGRSFNDWTMGFADITPQELENIIGANNFLAAGESGAGIGAGRARKLLEAFRLGRWRASLRSGDTHAGLVPGNPPGIGPARTFAYQPIIHAPTRSIFSYEALLRGPAGQPAGEILRQVNPEDMHDFDTQSRSEALERAARLGLSTKINLNFLPSTLEQSPTAISSLLLAALRCHIRPAQIVLEILEREIIHNSAGFTAAMNRYRGSGMTFAIDDFGAGYAGLNLLAEFQPDFVKADMHLIRGIESNGPRQAIVCGVIRTCADLGIDVIAEGAETAAEYAWLRSEGIEFFQGHFFARPAFEQLPTDFNLPPD